MMTDVPQLIDKKLFVRPESTEKAYFNKILKLKDQEKYQ